ncbi:helix-turn-helix transcriptional regulator [Actinomycetospora sp. TBRC 11914]|uniref:helix-turn-helix domain-containing protein n=1 Tax=Actinomycetospora sp. TBRC 11914 TaxID=2729387 RepID=UPI00145DEDD6|nr:helix-turn-helix transcriptional regulator [Actinomycetospora sp. TBRC 11914]NMO88622.1 helix-turn-helix domain-containing protein [Actinomycetospora sp. TBRC 11914]
MERTTATLRRKELGRRLRELRTAGSWTMEDAARVLHCSTAKISRLESGTRSASVRDVRDLCGFYKLADNEIAELEELARQSHQSSWWQSYSLTYGTFIGLEQSAETISEYATLIVPGLLQTYDFAKSVVSTLEPSLTELVVEDRAKARIARQEILEQNDPPDLWSIIDELALFRVVGSETIMERQIEHLIEISRLPNVHLQIIPVTEGLYQGYPFHFTLHEFSQEDMRPVVYVEGQSGDLYLERGDETSKYRRLFNELRSIGNGPRESRVLLEKHLRRLAPR